MKARLVIGLIAVLLVASFAAPVSAQDDACLQRGGQVNPDTGDCEVTMQVNVHILYPAEYMQYNFAAVAIDQFVSGTRSAFLAPLSGEPYYSPGPLSLELTYQIFPFSDTVGSVLYTIFEYTGGAHPLTTYQSFVFDTANQRVLTLADIFQTGVDPLAVIAPIARQNLEQQLTQEMGADASNLDVQWLDEGTAPKPENYTVWVLTSTSLDITFPAYQVAAYAMGPHTVSIPLSDLATVLKPEFTLAG